MYNIYILYKNIKIKNTSRRISYFTLSIDKTELISVIYFLKDSQSFSQHIKTIFENPRTVK